MLYKKLKAGIIVPIIVFCCTGAHSEANAQASGGMKISNRHEAYLDSMKGVDYKYALPIWGKRLVKKGFDIQYPFGAMVNSFIADQRINITDLKVGINDLAPVPLNFIKFGKVDAKAYTLNGRVDAWIFPFLDVYVVGGKTWTQTNVEIVEPFQMNSKAKFDGNTFATGITLAGGYHGYLTIIDLNHSWTNLDRIKGTIQGTLFTPRVGYNFIFKNKPDQGVAVWVGVSGLFISRTTEGTIPVSDLVTDATREKLQEVVNEVDAWYQDLKPAEKAVIKEIAQKLIDKMDGKDVKDAVISYSLNKQPTSNWSMVLGAQYQLNHRWQFRTEFGFFGGRQSVLLSGNYRWRW